jgi:hypothetical protein
MFPELPEARMEMRRLIALVLLCSANQMYSQVQIRGAKNLISG